MGSAPSSHQPINILGGEASGELSSSSFCCHLNHSEKLQNFGSGLAREAHTFSSERTLRQKKNYDLHHQTIHESFLQTHSRPRPLKTFSSLPNEIQVNRSYPSSYPLKTCHHEEVNVKLKEPQQVHLDVKRPHSLSLPSSPGLSIPSDKHGRFLSLSSQHVNSSSTLIMVKERSKNSLNNSTPPPVSLSTVSTTSQQPKDSPKNQSDDSNSKSVVLPRPTKPPISYLHPNYVSSDSNSSLHRKTVVSNHLPQLRQRRREGPLWQECASATASHVNTLNSSSTHPSQTSHSLSRSSNQVASTRIPDDVNPRSFSPFKTFHNDSQPLQNSVSDFSIVQQHQKSHADRTTPCTTPPPEVNLGNDECRITVTAPTFPPSMTPKHRLHKKHHHISKRLFQLHTRRQELINDHPIYAHFKNFKEESLSEQYVDEFEQEVKL
nr:unnamed protein product [Naegleria fowleri]